MYSGSAKERVAMKLFIVTTYYPYYIPVTEEKDAPENTSLSSRDKNNCNWWMIFKCSTYFLLVNCFGLLQFTYSACQNVWKSIRKKNVEIEGKTLVNWWLSLIFWEKKLAQFTGLNHFTSKIRKNWWSFCLRKCLPLNVKDGTLSHLDNSLTLLKSVQNGVGDFHYFLL